MNDSHVTGAAAASLLGEGHAQLVRDLLTRLDAIVAGDTSVPRVVVLEGASGTGKSRIVREVYKTLAARQPVPAYWPSLPERPSRDAMGGGAGADPLPDRKQLGPSLDGFVWPAGTLPTFGWWVLDCDRMPRGDVLDVISQARPALSAHLLPTRLAWREAVGWPGQLKAHRAKLIERAKEAVVEGGMQGADAFLSSIDVVVPGLGLGLGWLKRGIAAYTTHQEEQGALDTDMRLCGEASGERVSAALELATMVAQVTHPSVPAIVVIEDLHLMGVDLAEFLTVMAKRQADHPVLVIGTAWPEGRHNRDYDRWLKATDLAGDLDHRRMPDLAEGDLVQLLRGYAPATDEASASRVVTRYPNPLALQLYLSLEDTQDQIRLAGGRLVVTQHDLEQLPTDIRDLHLLRWRELPSLTRTTLSYAAGALPPGQPGFPHTIDLVAHAIAEVSVDLSVATTTQALEEAIDPYAWTEVATFGMARFRESVLCEVAEGNLSKLKRSAIHSAIRAHLVALLDDRRGDSYWLSSEEALTHASSWLVGMPPADGVMTVADSVALVHTARMLDNAYDFAGAARLLDEHQWRAPLDPDHPDTLGIRGLYAAWLVDLGRVNPAVAAFVSLIDDQQRVLGPNHPDTLTSRNNLAFAYWSAGDLSRAISAFEQNLADRHRILGPDHPDTLSSRNNLAATYASAGDLGRAIAAHEQNLADTKRVLGPDHPDTLRLRGNLAFAYKSTGDLARAIPAFEQLLVDTERVLGPDHIDTMIWRANLAFAYKSAGHLARAIPAFVHILADRYRILGPDHPDTLSSRRDLASAYASAGDLALAIPAFEQLLADTERVLGPDHPDTLRSRNNLASAYASAGDLALAIPAFVQILADLHRIFGPDHPDTLNSRGDLASAYKSAGDLARAIPAFVQLRADTERVLGPDHPNTLNSRYNLASAYESAGDLARAIPAFERLLVDTVRVFGPDHPNTLSSRSSLASAYKSAGDFIRAIPAYEEVLVDTFRVLGPDHPHTLNSRNDLALAFLSVGDLARAIPAFEQIVPHTERVLGPDHPQTLSFRSNLAQAYLSEGDLSRAVPAFEQILTDRQRILSANHPDIMGSRNNLAYAYAAAGDWGRAIPAYEHILVDTERVLGPDHAGTMKSRNNLAFAYELSGNLARAIPIYEQNLADRQRILGPEHPDTLTSRKNLDFAYASVRAAGENLLGDLPPGGRVRRSSWSRRR